MPGKKQTLALLAAAVAAVIAAYKGELIANDAKPSVIQDAEHLEHTLAKIQKETNVLKQEFGRG